MKRLRVAGRAVVAAVVVGAIAYTGYWFLVAARIEGGIAAWVTETRAAGYEVTHGRIAVGGFPLAFRIDVVEPHIARTSGPLPWTWRTEAMRVRLSPLRLDRAIAEIDAVQELTVRYAPDDAITARANRSVIETALQPNAPWTATLASLIVTSNRWTFPSAARAAIGFGPGATGAPVVTAELGDVTAPVGDWALGPKIERLALAFRATGTFPEAPFWDALRAWRDSGGTIEVERLDLLWAKVALGASGTLALDPQGRPLAAFAGTIRGGETAIDAIGAAQRMSAAQIAALKVGLRVIGKPNGDGVDVSATIQDGRVFVGSIPVGRVGTLLP